MRTVVWVIRGAWRAMDGHLHRTTGPAMEEWTVPPGGGGLSAEGWVSARTVEVRYAIGALTERQPALEGRPGRRQWGVAVDGTRGLVEKAGWHRVGRPPCRGWTVTPGGAQTLAWALWHANGNLRCVVGPHDFIWHDRQVRQKGMMPWFGRGRWLDQGGGGGRVGSL